MSSGYEPPDTPGNLKPASRRPPGEHQRTELVHLYAPPRPRTAQVLSCVIGARRASAINGSGSWSRCVMGHRRCTGCDIRSFGARPQSAGLDADAVRDGTLRARPARRPVPPAGTFLITPRGGSRHHRPVRRRRVSPRRQARPVTIFDACKAADVAAIAAGRVARGAGIEDPALAVKIELVDEHAQRGRVLIPERVPSNAKTRSRSSSTW